MLPQEQTKGKTQITDIVDDSDSDDDHGGGTGDEEGSEEDMEAEGPEGSAGGQGGGHVAPGSTSESPRVSGGTQEEMPGSLEAQVCDHIEFGHFFKKAFS